jgi:hypothetical protein
MAANLDPFSQIKVKGADRVIRKINETYGVNPPTRRKQNKSRGSFQSSGQSL